MSKLNSIIQKFIDYLPRDAELKRAVVVFYRQEKFKERRMKEKNMNHVGFFQG
jgi:hypothetical protein